jgi:pimeloyl-ACP methyl ester carboxylesterase
VQPALARLTRVCSYDRAGYGNSGPGPFPRTSARIAEELHRLLEIAAERPPYVLVGHSFGGFNVRVFHGRYPEKVAGLILVDATQEDQYKRLPPEWNALRLAMLARYKNQARWAPINIEFGITRFLFWIQRTEVPHLLLQTKYLRARASELEAIQTSAEQARRAGDIGAKPLIVLTAGFHSDRLITESLSLSQLEQYQNIWVNDLQSRLVRLSARGKRIVLQDSGHDIPAERPGAVVDAVLEVLATLRKGNEQKRMIGPKG